MEGGAEQGQVPPTVGLLCGGGRLPRVIADVLRGKGSRVVAVCISGEADPETAEAADEAHWSGLARLGAWIRTFKRAGAQTVLMVGSINKRRMFGSKLAMMPDWRTVRFWYGRLRSKEDHTILGAVADEFEREGLRLGTVPELCPELLVPRGCLTGREPTEGQWRDIRFAWPLVKQIAALQIGQCIVVKDQAVLAVEGIDGTDATLKRGGRLGRGGVVAVKVPREGHDERFDIPCVGPGTVDTLKEARAAVLALQAGGAILLDADEVRRRGRKAGIAIVGLTAEDLEPDAG